MEPEQTFLCSEEIKTATHVLIISVNTNESKPVWSMTLEKKLVSKGKKNKQREMIGTYPEYTGDFRDCIHNITFWLSECGVHDISDHEILELIDILENKITTM